MLNRSIAWVLVVACCAAACGGGANGDGGADGSDARDTGDAIAPDAPPRNDRLNLNCTLSGGDLAANDCNQMLMSMGGASFFVGGRAECSPDPNSPFCVPLCALTDINPANCTFSMPSGCPYNHTEGYVVVVQLGSNRASAAVAMSDTCGANPMGVTTWARVDFNDLLGTLQCLQSIPDGGLGPVRYDTCTTPMAACGDMTATPADTCQQVQFMTGTTTMTGNLCSHMCMVDGDCGPRGSCQNGLCFATCGGVCNLQCPSTSFSCQRPSGAMLGYCIPPLM